MSGARDRSEEVLAEAQRLNPNCLDFKIIDVKAEFLGGQLYTVNFENPNLPSADNSGYINRFYVTARSIKHFRNDETLLSVLGATHSRGALERVFGIDVIAGVIALLVAAAIIYIVAIKGEGDVPEILSGSLTVILGFYFGRASGQQRGG